jgi:radical SAM protein with 4Fe4S-binding SPASM domain
MSENNRHPKIIGWEITRQCNLTCPHCFSAAAKRPHNELTFDECRAAIDSMAEIGVQMIGWTGGEPLLCDYLEDLILYARQKGIKSNITTNGVLLDERRALSLKKAGNRAMQISLDGSTPERNHRMRGASEAEFHKIIEAIRICKRLNIRTVLATLLGEENLDDANEMVRLAEREGLDSIRFCGFTPVGRGKNSNIKERLNFSQKLNDLKTFIEDIQDQSTCVVEFDPGLGPVPPDYSFHQCVAGMTIFYLKANGDIYPCTALIDRKFLVGNIRQRHLVEIWNDPAMMAMASYDRSQIEGICRECDNLANCHGACRGTVFAHTGELNASLPFCLYKLACELIA